MKRKHTKLRDALTMDSQSPGRWEAVLRARRKAAAETSAGISADFLYDKFEEIVRRYHLSGSVLDCGAGRGLLTRRLVDIGVFASIAAADILNRPTDLHPKVRWIDADL